MKYRVKGAPAQTMSLPARKQFLDNAELVHRLRQVGEDRRASFLHRNLTGEAQRMESELRHVQLPAPTRKKHIEHIANLHKAAIHVLLHKKPALGKLH